MPLDPVLLDILACPEDHGSLILIEDEALYNPRLRKAYPIENGIPVLLIDEARDIDDETHARYIAAGTPSE